MAEDGLEWPTDNRPSRRWPIYTRGNIGEVYPDVVMPLEWALAGEAAEQGWRDGAEEIGFLTQGDYGPDRLVILGVFGGYAYFNASLIRLLGVRTPGLAVDVIDTQFLGDADVPGYSPKPGDRNLKATARLIRTALRTFRAKQVPRLGEMRRFAETQLAQAPALDAPSDELWRFVRHQMAANTAYFIGSHVIVTMQATIAAGALTDLCEKHLDDPNLALSLTTGIGDVVSAAPAREMWKLANETGADDYDKAFTRFLDRYGHRGPNEFSILGRDWAAFPELATAAIDAMRGVDPDRSPERQHARMVEQREATVADVRSRVGSRTARRIEGAADNTALWSRAREESKDILIWANQSIRHRMLELLRRAADAGGVADREGPMLLTADEFERYLDNPSSMVATIEERRTDLDRLRGLEPTFAFDASAHGDRAPATSTWRARKAELDAADGGSVLDGAAGAPGKVRGRARVITEPDDPTALEPGDILVAPLTDPSWTPLFVPAGGVVVEIGAAMSHSMIVSRELGIPCVVGVVDACLRIPDGTEIEVDGTTGTVTIIQQP